MYLSAIFVSIYSHSALILINSSHVDAPFIMIHHFYVCIAGVLSLAPRQWYSNNQRLTA